MAAPKKKKARPKYSLDNLPPPPVPPPKPKRRHRRTKKVVALDPKVFSEAFGDRIAVVRCLDDDRTEIALSWGRDTVHLAVDFPDGKIRKALDGLVKEVLEAQGVAG